MSVKKQPPKAKHQSKEHSKCKTPILLMVFMAALILAVTMDILKSQEEYGFNSMESPVLKNLACAWSEYHEGHNPDSDVYIVDCSKKKRP